MDETRVMTSATFLALLCNTLEDALAFQKELYDAEVATGSAETDFLYEPERLHMTENLGQMSLDKGHVVLHLERHLLVHDAMHEANQLEVWAKNIGNWVVVTAEHDCLALTIILHFWCWFSWHRCDQKRMAVSCWWTGGTLSTRWSSHTNALLWHGSRCTALLAFLCYPKCQRFNGLDNRLYSCEVTEVRTVCNPLAAGERKLSAQQNYACSTSRRGCFMFWICMGLP